MTLNMLKQGDVATTAAAVAEPDACLPFVKQLHA
jgi:hypothetical protein